MCINVGKIDRAIRIVLGIALIAYGIVAPNYLIAAVGLIPLVTALVGICPLYFPFKINTGCPSEKKASSDD